MKLEIFGITGDKKNSQQEERYLQWETTSELSVQQFRY